MKWFDRWFHRRWMHSWHNRDELEEVLAESTAKRGARLAGRGHDIEEDPHDVNDGLRIAVKRVVGGSIVTFRTYDRHRDRTDHRTYIITDEQDFERELGKCITLESMRQSGH